MEAMAVPGIPRPVSMALALALVFFPSVAAAQNDGVPLLYDPFTIESARVSGMGRVAATAGDGTTDTWWNPAGLSFEPTRRVTFSSADLTIFIGDDDYVRGVTVSGPLPFGPPGLAGGLGFKRLDFGDFDLSGGGGEEFRTSSFEHAYVAALAYPIAPHLSVGLQLEYLWLHPTDAVPELNIPSDVTGGTAALGVGVAYERRIDFASHSPDTGPQPAGARGIVLTPMAGASLLHIGPKLEYSDGDDSDLLRQFRIGAGLGVGHEPAIGTPPFARARLGQFHFVAAVEGFVPVVEIGEITHDMIMFTSAPSSPCSGC